jgi:hypothetical protein
MGSDSSPVHCHFSIAKPLKQCLIDVTSFRLSKLLYSRSFLFCRTNNFGSVFTDRFDHTIYETKFPTHVGFLLFHFIFVAPF